MGYLRHIVTNTICPLQSHHTFGRRASIVDTLVDAPEISKIHTLFEWEMGSWHIKDLSRNGTWLNNKKITPGRRITIQEGSIISLLNKDKYTWRAEDISPPSNQLIAINETSMAISLDDIHLLPSDKNPLKVLQHSPKNDEWHLSDIYENGPTITNNSIVRHGDIIEIDRQYWVLSLLSKDPLTNNLADKANNINVYQLIFNVSLDEECTHLSIYNLHDNEVVDLGDRSHHYLLMHLARQRCHDHHQRIDSDNQGWIITEILEKEIGLEISHINILIYRARKQINELFDKKIDTASLIERKHGRIRIGCENLFIKKGHEIIKTSDNNAEDITNQ